MRRRVCNLPLALLGGIFLLLQALAVGLGPGARICLDPVCAQVVVATADACCGGDCDDATPEAPADQPCDCRWLPIPDEPLAELAVTTCPAQAPPATAPPILLPLPAAPVRLAVRPPDLRPPPHLAALRSVVLTC